MVSSTKHHRNISTGRYKGLPAEKPVRSAQPVEPQPEPKEEIEEIVYGLYIEEAFKERTFQEKVDDFKHTIADRLSLIEFGGRWYTAGLSLKPKHTKQDPTVEYIVEDAKEPEVATVEIVPEVENGDNLPDDLVIEEPPEPTPAKRDLAEILMNKDVFAYNRETGDLKFNYFGRFEKDDEWNKYVFDERTFTFKFTGLKSNALLLEDIVPDHGENLDETTTLADFFNNVTRYGRINSEHREKIKEILYVSYLLNFGVELKKEDILIQYDSEGKVSSIEYLETDDRAIKTTIATKGDPVEIETGLTDDGFDLQFPLSEEFHCLFVAESDLKRAEDFIDESESL